MAKDGDGKFGNGRASECELTVEVEAELGGRGPDALYPVAVLEARGRATAALEESSVEGAVSGLGTLGGKKVCGGGAGPTLGGCGTIWGAIWEGTWAGDSGSKSRSNGH